jgi:hypothetical protein
LRAGGSSGAAGVLLLSVVVIVVVEREKNAVKSFEGWTNAMVLYWAYHDHNTVPGLSQATGTTVLPVPFRAWARRMSINNVSGQAVVLPT